LDAATVANTLGPMKYRTDGGDASGVCLQLRVALVRGSEVGWSKFGPEGFFACFGRN